MKQGNGNVEQALSASRQQKMYSYGHNLHGCGKAWKRAAWTLVLGGGVGNLIDRVLNGVVVDYINVLFMRFAIFNFADICVCVGVGLLMLAVLLDSFKKDKTAEPDRKSVV